MGIKSVTKRVSIVTSARTTSECNRPLILRDLPHRFHRRSLDFRTLPVTIDVVEIKEVSFTVAVGRSTFITFILVYF